MKVLGIDYGEKKIGIAISDELGLFARGLCTLVRKNVRADLQFLREIIDREKVSLLVLGLPQIRWFGRYSVRKGPAVCREIGGHVSFTRYFR